MAVSKSQIIENAQRYAASGKIDTAIAEWTKLLSDPPQAQDGNVYNTISDLYLRKNDKENAVNTCLKAASVYKETGFDLKGVALLKKVFKIDPDRVDIHEKLADINADRGLTGGAIAGYQQTVKLYIQRGSFLAAIGVYKKLARFFPDDPEMHLAIARLHQKMEQTREAILAYEQAEAIYESKKLNVEARQIVEEIVKLNPNYIKHLAKKESSVAELDALVSPKDTMLSAASAQGLSSMQDALPMEQTESSEQNIESPTFNTRSPVLEVTPEDIPRLSILEGQYSTESFVHVKDAAQDPTVSFKEAPFADFLPPIAQEQHIEEQKPSGGTELISQRTNVQSLKSIETPDVSEVIFRAHLAEVDVYLRYGLNQNAIEKLALAKELDPTRDEPYLRLRALYLKEGQNDMAAREVLALTKLYERQGQHEKKEALMSEMRTIDSHESQPERNVRPVQETSYRPPLGNMGPVAQTPPPLSAPAREAFSYVPPPPPQATPRYPVPPSSVPRESLSTGGYPVASREPASFTSGRSGNRAREEEEYFDLGSAIVKEFGDLTKMPTPPNERPRPVPARDPYEDKQQQYIETCYHLGIAHKEMGHYDKAVRELEQALAGSKGKQFREVLLLLALCYAESGYIAQAIEVLQGGVEDARCDPDSRPFVQYDLASYFEQLGDKERSFAIYKEIYRAHPHFKDVSGKIKEIPYRRAGLDIGSERSLDAMPVDERVAPPVQFRGGVEAIKGKRRISYV